jgi:predicted nuclease with RNAse H fold
MYALGFDPGGVTQNAFGWAIISNSSGEWHVHCSGTCGSASAAVKDAAPHLPESPIAVGIDAPLYWVLDGDRKAGKFVRDWVRETDRSKSSTVNHVNSLKGACLVQGVLAVCLVHDWWPNALITEAHPKALWCTTESARSFVQRNLAKLKCNEHKRDAALAAFAAAQAYANGESGWTNLAVLDPEPYFPFPSDVSVSYYFPSKPPNKANPDGIAAA